MNLWTVTIPTIRPTGAGWVSGTQTWFVTSTSSAQAAKVALGRSQSPACVRHRRGAALVPDRMTCAPLRDDGVLGYRH